MFGGGRGSLRDIGGSEGPGGFTGNNQRLSLGGGRRASASPRTGSHVVGQASISNSPEPAPGVSGGGRYAAQGGGTPQDLFNNMNTRRNTGNTADPRATLGERYAEGAAQGSYGLGSLISNGVFLPAWEAGKSITQNVPGMGGIVNPILRGITGTSAADPSTDPGIVPGQSSPADIDNVWAGWNGLLDGYNHGDNPGFSPDPRYAPNDSYMQTPQGGEPAGTGAPWEFGGTAGYGGFEGTAPPATDEFGAVTDPTYFSPATQGPNPDGSGQSGSPDDPFQSNPYVDYQAPYMPQQDYSPAGFTPGSVGFNGPLDGWGGSSQQYGPTPMGQHGYWQAPRYGG